MDMKPCWNCKIWYVSRDEEFCSYCSQRFPFDGVERMSDYDSEISDLESKVFSGNDLVEKIKYVSLFLILIFIIYLIWPLIVVIIAWIIGLLLVIAAIALIETVIGTILLGFCAMYVFSTYGTMGDLNKWVQQNILNAFMFLGVPFLMSLLFWYFKYRINERIEFAISELHNKKEMEFRKEKNSVLEKINSYPNMILEINSRINKLEKQVIDLEESNIESKNDQIEKVNGAIGENKKRLRIINYQRWAIELSKIINHANYWTYRPERLAGEGDIQKMKNVLNEYKSLVNVQRYPFLANEWEFNEEFMGFVNENSLLEYERLNKDLKKFEWVMIDREVHFDSQIVVGIIENLQEYQKNYSRSSDVQFLEKYKSFIMSAKQNISGFLFMIGNKYDMTHESVLRIVKICNDITEELNLIYEKIISKMTELLAPDDMMFNHDRKYDEKISNHMNNLNSYCKAMREVYKVSMIDDRNDINNYKTEIKSREELVNVMNNL